MKAPATFTAAAVSFMALSLSALNANDGGVGAAVTLRDSSVIKGTVAPDTVFEGGIVFDSSAKRSFPMGCEIGGMALPVPAVGEMVANGTNGVQVITLVNGDKFHFNLKAKALPVSTSLGDFSIPFSSIRRLAFIAKEEPPAGSLIFHCTFDSPESVEKPAVGPGGTVLMPGAFETGKINGAMRVSPRTESARFSIPAGFLKDKGCIEWWAKIQSPLDGFSSCDPRFFRIRFSETVDSVFEFSSNDGAGGGGLVIRFPGLLYLQKPHRRTAWLYSQYFGESGVHDWHHYAIVWNTEGLPFPDESAHYQLAVFIDGTRIHVEPYDWRQKISLATLESKSATIDFPFNSDYDNPLIGKADYLIDDMKIWDCDTPPAPLGD